MLSYVSVTTLARKGQPASSLEGVLSQVVLRSTCVNNSPLGISSQAGPQTGGQLIGSTASLWQVPTVAGTGGQGRAGTRSQSHGWGSPLDWQLWVPPAFSFNLALGHGTGPDSSQASTFV